jgi:threonine dehydratase
MFPYRWLLEAAARIRPHIRRTPLTADPTLGLYFKWENRQVTGSFKARGALNKVLTLEAWERERGLVTASAGNHGQGVALAGKLVGAPVLVFASAQAVPAKLEAIRQLGAQVRLVPGGYGEAEAAALEYAAAQEATWVSPYNDAQIIAGQGTLALETLEDLAALDGAPVPAVWVTPVGGGGLLAGIGAALKENPEAPPARLVGVQSEASPFFHHLYHTGSQAGAEDLPSLADGLAGAVEDRSITLPMARRYAGDILLVSEAEIAQAVGYAWSRHGERIEGSAAVALAAVLSGRVADRPAVVVLTGGNIQPETFEQILAGADGAA